jgi:flagellar basal body-associated protein FliL
MDPLTELTQAVDRLADQGLELRRALDRRSRALWVAVIVSAVVLVAAIAAASTVLLDNRRALAENNRRWCPMVLALVPRPGDPQPTTDRGRVVAAEFRRLAVEFDCG